MKTEMTISSTGTEKVYDELRNLPCPHLKETAKSGSRCKLLKSVCSPNASEDCPVIIALVEYIPWKREMAEEEEAYGEMARWHRDADTMPGMEDDEEDGHTYSTGHIKIGAMSVYPEQNYRIIRMGGKEDYIGKFVDLKDGDTIRMTGDNHGHYVLINLNDIVQVEHMTYADMRCHHGKDIRGVDMEVDNFYTITMDDKTTYTGEFMGADAVSIRMKADLEFKRILVEDIKKVDHIH